MIYNQYRKVRQNENEEIPNQGSSPPGPENNQAMATQQTMRPLLLVYDRSYFNKSGNLLSFMVIYNFLCLQKFLRFFFLIVMVICEIKWSLMIFIYLFATIKTHV